MNFKGIIKLQQENTQEVENRKGKEKGGGEDAMEQIVSINFISR